jgi:hypothetical protein
MSTEQEKAERLRVRDAVKTRTSDLKRLMKAPAEGSMVPGLAQLSPYQIIEIERMSTQGLDLDTIGARLRIPLDVWNQLIKINPDIAEAYRAGVARGRDTISQAAYNGAKAGEPSLIRFYLERQGGPNFKKQEGPQVVVHAGPVASIDVGDIDRRFARQRALLDGTCEELDDGGPQD